MEMENLELVHEEALLNLESIGIKDEIAYTVNFDYDKNIFICTINEDEFVVAPEIIIYSLDKSIEKLTVSEALDILNYCLSSIDSEDRVSLSDVFLHAEHTTLLSYIFDGVETIVSKKQSPKDISPRNFMELNFHIQAIKALNIDGETFDYLTKELEFGDYVISKYNYGKDNPFNENNQ